MLDAAQCLDTILSRIDQCGSVLLLDFDGVLAPLVRDPATARLPLATKRQVERCAARMPVAIITGRPLADIEQRVALKNIHYAGSHGLEWKVNGRRYCKAISASKRSGYEAVRSELLKLATEFPGLLVEEKRYCVALGYRSLSKVQTRRFLNGAHAAVRAHLGRGTVRLLDNQGTFEVLVASEWTKGECANHISQLIGNHGDLPIYIGDSLTDEDAFRALASGITIRVAEEPSSAAKYFFHSRRNVSEFLCALASRPA